MNKSIYVVIACGLALVGAGVAGTKGGTVASTATQRHPREFVIRDVRVFDGERMIPKASVHVRDGKIVSVGDTAPGGIESIPGDGRTLLPGLIDAHTHAFGDALERALVFGVTTELDMFTDHRFAATMRTEQGRADGAPRRADILSAGTLVTSPKGHGTEYGLQIPTLASAADAQAFVDARIAEGSDYIKIVYDDGATYGMKIATIDRTVLGAAIEAAKKRGKLAVVHIGSRQGADDAIAAGASGLVHIFADAPADAAFVNRVAAARAFVTPTLSVTESTTGVASGAPLLKDARLAPFITAVNGRRSRDDSRSARIETEPGRRPRRHQAALRRGRSDSGRHRRAEPRNVARVEPSPRARAAGPGRTLPGSRPRGGDVRAGAHLQPARQGARRARTSRRPRAGQWRSEPRHHRDAGHRVDLEARRSSGAGEGSSGDRGCSCGDHDRPRQRLRCSADIRAEFGSGWQPSTDSLMGGKSTATLAVVQGGANKTRGALEVSGTIAEGLAYPWAGAMFFPAATPMAPADLSKFKEIVFWARGDGGAHQVMVFAARLGNIPATQPFTPGPEWREFVLPLASFSNLDGSDLRGVLFSAGSKPGPFRFTIDEVRFR